MKKMVALALGIGMLGGCHFWVWKNQFKPDTQFLSEEKACQELALKQYPVRMVTYSSETAGAGTYDGWASLRQEAVDQCLRRLGWEWTRVPRSECSERPCNYISY